MSMKPEVDLVDVVGIKSLGDVLSNDNAFSNNDLTQEMGKSVDVRLVCFHLGALAVKYFGLTDEEEKEKNAFYKERERFIFTKNGRVRFLKVLCSLGLLTLIFFLFLFYIFLLETGSIVKGLFGSVCVTVVMIVLIQFTTMETFITSFLKTYLNRFEFEGGSNSAFLRSLKIDVEKDLNLDDVSAYLSWVRAMAVKIDGFYKLPRDVNWVGNFKKGSLNFSDYQMSRAISRLLDDLRESEKSLTNYKEALSEKVGYNDMVASERELKRNLLNVSSRYGIFVRTLLSRKDNPYKDVMSDMLDEHLQKRDVELNQRRKIERDEMIKQTIKNNEKLLNLIGESDK